MNRRIILYSLTILCLCALLSTASDSDVAEANSSSSPSSPSTPFRAFQTAHEDREKSAALFLELLQSSDISKERQNGIVSRLSEMSLEGWHPPKKHTISIQPFKKILEQKISSWDKCGMFILLYGKMHYYAHKDHRDYKEAYKAFSHLVNHFKRFEKTHVVARYYLASCYHHAHGVRRDRGRAERIFQEIVDNPNLPEVYAAEVKWRLADSYYLSRLRDPQKLELARKYSESLVGNPYLDIDCPENFSCEECVRYNLARMLQYGQGGPQDIERARELYQTILDKPIWAATLSGVKLHMKRMQVDVNDSITKN